jgi:hypothetical protein
MLRRFIASLLVFALVSFAASARADGPAAAPEPAKAEVWYGWQTIVVDAAAMAMMLGVASDIDPHGDVQKAGIATYALAPPLVHLAHGSVSKAGASFGIRVLGPIIGAAIGFGMGYALGAVSTGEEVPGLLFGTVGLVLGGTFGYVGAVAVDSAVLARER